MKAYLWQNRIGRIPKIDDEFPESAWRCLIVSQVGQKTTCFKNPLTAVHQLMAQPTRRVTVLIALALALTAGVVRASFTDDFYANVLHRGIAYADAGNDLAAVKELRIAAFGLVEDVPKFELAESYLAVVAHRLKRDDEARHSLQRLVAAERVERHYASLPLPKDMRPSVQDA